MCADIIIFLTALEAWIADSPSVFVRSNVEVVIDDLHGRESRCLEGVSTSNNMAQGNKGAVGVQFNAMKTDEDITVAVRVKSDGESLAECISGLINSAREGGVQMSSIMLDRGYKYEATIAEIMKARAVDVAKHVDIVGTVRKNSCQFIPRQLSVSNASNEDDQVRSGKPFCVEGAQGALDDAHTFAAD